MYGFSAFLLTISAASGLLPATFHSPKAFHYPKTINTFYHQSHPNGCTICDGSDCLAMGDAKCEYYRELNEILHEEDQESLVDNPTLKAEVDELLFGLTLQESIVNSECVPYVSSYTNCNKDNICLGCTTCDCDAGGRWNCSRTTKCRADEMLNVDHRILVQVMENLNIAKRDTRIRRKRSADDTVILNTTELGQLTSQEISLLINGGNKQTDRNNNDDTKILELDNKTDNVESTKSSTTEQNESLNDSNLDFDDFFLTTFNLSNGNISKLHLPMLKNHTEDILDPDYMDIVEDNATQTDDTQRSVENSYRDQNNLLTEKPEKQEGPKLIFYTKLNNKEVSDIDINSKEDRFSDFGDLNDISEGKSVHMVKREISNRFENDYPQNNFKHYVQDLKENVLNPLTSIINNKNNELRELERMRDNLINYIKMHTNNETHFNFNHTALDNVTKSYFTLYKLELIPNFHNEQIKSNPIILNDYMFKLKNDIYEVIKDIAEIQKNAHYKGLPDDLNVLTQAMKYFVHSQGKIHIEKKMKKFTETKNKNYRKSFSVNPNKIMLDPATHVVQQILNVIDKDMPRSNALAALSNGARKILKRIIKQNYRDEFTSTGIRVFDSQYNITKDLENIGIKWYRLTRNIASSPTADRLFNMKLLQLELSRDICKLNDALALVSFAQGRRAFKIDEHLTEQFASRITEDIEVINNKIQQIIRMQNENVQRNPNKTTKKPKTNKKESFMQQVKNLLKQSKKDIKNIFKNKVKKQNKQLNDYATQKDRLPFDEKTMKWQKHSGAIIADRNKRSPVEFNNIVKRIKNIIPNYLKGKVDNKIGKPKAIDNHKF